MVPEEREGDDWCLVRGTLTEEVEDERRCVGKGSQVRLGSCVAIQLGFEGCICLFSLCGEMTHLTVSMQVNLNAIDYGI